MTHVHRLYTGLKALCKCIQACLNTLRSVICAQALDINSDGYISKQELLVASQVIVMPHLMFIDLLTNQTRNLSCVIKTIQIMILDIILK